MTSLAAAYQRPLVGAAAPQQPAPAAVGVAVAPEQLDEALLPAARPGGAADRRGGVVRVQVVEQRVPDQLARADARARARTRR